MPRERNQVAITVLNKHSGCHRWQKTISHYKLREAQCQLTEYVNRIILHASRIEDFSTQ